MHNCEHRYIVLASLSFLKPVLSPPSPTERDYMQVSLPLKSLPLKEQANTAFF
jgi:hypothetical protein